MNIPNEVLLIIFNYSDLDPSISFVSKRFEFLYFVIFERRKNLELFKSARNNNHVTFNKLFRLYEYNDNIIQHSFDIACIVGSYEIFILLYYRSKISQWNLESLCSSGLSYALTDELNDYKLNISNNRDGYYKIISFIVNNYSKFDYHLGYISMDICCTYGNIKVLKLLVEKDVEVRQYHILHALEENQYKLLDYVLKEQLFSQEDLKIFIHNFHRVGILGEKEDFLLRYVKKYNYLPVMFFGMILVSKIIIFTTFLIFHTPTTPIIG